MSATTTTANGQRSEYHIGRRVEALEGNYLAEIEGIYRASVEGAEVAAAAYERATGQSIAPDPVAARSADLDARERALVEREQQLNRRAQSLDQRELDVRSLEDRAQAQATAKPAAEEITSALADIAAESEGSEEISEEDAEMAKYQASILNQMDKQERSTLYAAILEAGGIKTSEDLREEYREIPNTYKRRDGLAGDVMAEYLASYYPELGIHSENDLLTFFADRSREDRHDKATR